MTLNIFDFLGDLIRFLFSGLGHLIDLAGSVFSFTLKAAATALSALSKIFSAPFRLGADTAQDVFGVPVLWTPLFVLGCAVLLLILLVLTGWALAARRRRKR